MKERKKRKKTKIMYKITVEIASLKNDSKMEKVCIIFVFIFSQSLKDSLFNANVTNKMTLISKFPFSLLIPNSFHSTKKLPINFTFL